ncbi:MAG: hypothetical protein Q9227_003684 [Pyrenula ochraceoflavens]
MAILLALLSFLSVSTLALPSPILEDRQTTTCAAIPSGYRAPTVSKLPNPFQLVSGATVTTKAQWACRQKEISQLMQQTELGTLPSTVPTVTSSMSGNTMTINVSDNGKSISFSVSIKPPTSGSAPYPAIIAYGGASIPIPNTVATITFNNDDIAAQNSASSRGQGKYYTLYGSNASAGAMTAWAWAVSRIIDALQKTPSANIDTTRVGVTGCSRNGKGAFVAGALDSRIALTIPQESGAGGAACWRISDQQQRAGKNIQTANEIVGENVWFSTAFNSYVSNTPTLPTDHHELAALVAPRGLFVIENDIDWLGPGSTTPCMEVGQLIYKGVGAPNAMGFSLVGGHAHCSFPSAQTNDLNKFITRYLLKGTVDSFVQVSSYSWNQADWVDWQVPAGLS